MKKDRYSRQIILPEIGIEGQKKISSSRVLCIGVGGLGSPTTLYLAAAGVGTIGIVDLDHVDESNLQRQILYRTADQGFSKVESAKKHLNQLNKDSNIVAYHTMLTDKNAEEILSQYDLIIDGSDNFETKFLINDAACKTGIPIIYGAISSFEGEVALFWGNHGACYRCFHPSPPAVKIANCAEAGVLGSIAGVIGSLQATLAIQYIISANEKKHPLQPLIGQLTKVDLNGKWDFKTFKIKKNPQCPTCSSSKKNIKLSFQNPSCSNTPSIESSELIKLLSNSETDQLLLLDVRDQNEWAEGNIPGATHWPLPLLVEGILPPDSEKEKKVVVYCKAGIRSQQAVQILIKNGFNESVSLHGGFDSFQSV